MYMYLKLQYLCCHHLSLKVWYRLRGLECWLMMLLFATKKQRNRVTRNTKSEKGKLSFFTKRKIRNMKPTQFLCMSKKYFVNFDKRYAKRQKSCQRNPIQNRFRKNFATDVLFLFDDNLQRICRGYFIAKS